MKKLVVVNTASDMKKSTADPWTDLATWQLRILFTSFSFHVQKNDNLILFLWKKNYNV